MPFLQAPSMPWVVAESRAAPAPYSYQQLNAVRSFYQNLMRTTPSLDQFSDLFRMGPGKKLRRFSQDFGYAIPTAEVALGRYTGAQSPLKTSIDVKKFYKGKGSAAITIAGVGGKTGASYSCPDVEFSLNNQGDGKYTVEIYGV